MLAASYVGARTMTIEEQEPAEPRAGEVRIAVAYVGICGTDLHVRTHRRSATACANSAVTSRDTASTSRTGGR